MQLCIIFPWRINYSSPKRSCPACFSIFSVKSLYIPLGDVHKQVLVTPNVIMSLRGEGVTQVTLMVDIIVTGCTKWSCSFL